MTSESQRMPPLSLGLLGQNNASPFTLAIVTVLLTCFV
jgi:hypothetical protein